MKYLYNILLKISVISHAIAQLIFLPALALFVCLNVVLRYFFNSPLIWGEEVNGLLLFLVLTLSLVYTWDVGKHIKMELLYENFGAKLKRFADFIGALCGIIFFGLMTLESIRDVGYMMKIQQTTEELRIPVAPFMIMLGVIAIIFTIRLIISLILIIKDKSDIVQHVSLED